MQNKTRRRSVHNYYNSRKSLNYYRKVKDILNGLQFESIIDIGSRRSPVLDGVAANKTLLDIHPMPERPGTHAIMADFYTWTPDKTYDVVLCLEVLEHLDRPAEFAQKLFETGRIVILSVPYKWPKGACKYHVQDPVDEVKIREWTGRDPIGQYCIADGVCWRMICVYGAQGK